MAELESTSGGPFAGQAREIYESFRRIQQACRKTGVQLPLNLIELLPSLTKESVGEPSTAINPN